MGRAFKLRNGTLLLSTEAPGGVYNSVQLKKIAAICDGEAAIVKATEDQRLALFVPAEKADEIAIELKGIGLGVRDYQSGLHQPTTCVGELCPEHLQDAMGAAMDLTTELSKIALVSPLKIGINGCERCCVPTHTLDISIIGDTEGYRISLGGKNSQIPEMAAFMAERVPAAKLPGLILKVVDLYKEYAEDEETLQETMERCGSGMFIEALAPYSQDAHHDDNPLATITAGADSSAPKPADTKDVGDDLDLGDLPEAEAIEEEEDLIAEDDHLSTDLADNATAANNLDDVISELETAEALEGAVEDFEEDLSLDDDISAGDMVGASDDSDVDINPNDFKKDQDLYGEVPISDDQDVGEFGGELEEGLTQDDVTLEEFGQEDVKVDQQEIDEFQPEEVSLDDISVESDEVEGFGGDDDEVETLETDDDAPTDDSIRDESVDASPVEDLSVDDLIDVEEPLTADPETDELVLEDVGTASVEAGGDAHGGTADAGTGETDDLDELQAEEVGEDDADAFEEKINASIEEEESMPPVEDLNYADRIETMKLVETSSAENEDFQGTNKELDADYDLEDLDDFEDFDDVNEFSVDDEVLEFDVKEEITQAGKQADPLSGPATRGTTVLSSAAGKGFEFSGIDFTSEGHVKVIFSSGAAVIVDPETVCGSGSRDISIAGKTIRISTGPHGIQVNVDGVGFMLPQQAA